MKAIVLLSGGLDSMACVHFYLKMGYEVSALFCDYGQPAAPQEREAAICIANYFTSLDKGTQPFVVCDG